MKKFFIVIFLIAIGFNAFHDYIISIAEKDISKYSYIDDTENGMSNSLENIHQILHMPYIENIDNDFSFKEFLTSQKPILKYQIHLKVLKKEIFKPPITV